MLVLEGAQAGLSLDHDPAASSEGYRAAFDGFDPAVVAEYGEEKLAALLAGHRHHPQPAKVAAAVKNARRVPGGPGRVRDLRRYIWRFVGGTPIRTRLDGDERRPGQHAAVRRAQQRPHEARARLRRLDDRYAFMQAAGLVNDHVGLLPLRRTV